jgi:hypothetical protein
MEGQTEKFTPRGKNSPLESKFAPRGEVKNGPLQGPYSEMGGSKRPPELQCDQIEKKTWLDTFSYIMFSQRAPKAVFLKKASRQHR